MTRAALLVLLLAACGSRDRSSARAPEETTAGATAAGGEPTAGAHATGAGSSGTVSEIPPPTALAETAPVRTCVGATSDRATVEDPRLTEISGIVASRRQPGVLWAHNDSGEEVARFFALQLDGRIRAEIVLDGASHVDPEDIALFVATDRRELVFFADAGDNGARDHSIDPRPSIDVIVVEPPLLGPDVRTDPLHDATFDRLTFIYPDGPHDSEGIFVDARTGDLYFFTKTASGPHALYRDRAPHGPGETRVLERVIELLPAEDLGDSITGADSDESGRIAIRTYRDAFLYDAAGSGSVEDTLSREPTLIDHLREYQGESIAFAADGTGLWSISEGEGETLHFVPFVDCR